MYPPAKSNATIDSNSAVDKTTRFEPGIRCDSGSPCPGAESGPAASRIFDRGDMVAALPGNRPINDPFDFDEASLTPEERTRSRCIERILKDPRGEERQILRGSEEMAVRVREAAATMPHFHDASGIIERSILQSTRTGKPLWFPPILFVSEPGQGKTFFCRRMADAIGTTNVSIPVNLTSDHGQLGGLSTVWRGAKMGKIVQALIACDTAAPLFLLDEIDKAPSLIAGENTTDVLLSALERENATAFRDEYLDAAVDVSSALWIASANDPTPIAGPLLDRFVVLEIPRPDPSYGRKLVEAIAEGPIWDSMLLGMEGGAIDLLVALPPRQVRRVVELACGFAVNERRWALGIHDVRRGLDLARVSRRRVVGFLG